MSGWATLDEGCNAACHSASWAARTERYFDMFGFSSEYREDTRPKVFTGLGGNTVAAAGRRKFPFALAFTSERDDIHHLSGTIESWELPGDGPFLFPTNAQAKLGLIKDMAKSRIFTENKPGFYLRMYKDAKTGLMLINVADFDFLNDQALLLRASKPMYALPATIPPPTSVTGGATSGEPVNILHSLAPMPGNPTLRFTHVVIGLDVMDEYPDTDGHFRRYISERHCGRAVTSLLEIEKTARCWSRSCVGDSQRRHAGRTLFSLIAVLSETQPAALYETIGESIRPRSPRSCVLASSQVWCWIWSSGSCDLPQGSPSQDPDWLHLHEGPPHSCLQLCHAGHPHCAQLLGEYSHDSTRFAWPSLVQS